MKNNSKTTALLMASLLVLTACGKNTKDSVDKNFPVDGSVFEKFSYNLNKNHSNCTVDVDGEYNSYYYSENAFLYDFGENYETNYGYVDTGYVKTSQGVFNYVLNNGEIALGQCVTVNPELSVLDMVIYPYHLLGDYKKWAVSEEDPTVYTSADSDTVYAAAFLAGWAEYSSYIDDQTITAKFNSVDDYSTVKVSYKLKHAVTVDLVFTNIGGTKNEKIDNYLKHPATLSNPSEYPAEFKNDMISTMGEEIPFVGASYAWTFNSENKQFTDIGCGYNLDKYDSALRKAGWTYVKASSSMEKDSEGNTGLEKNYYIKRNYNSTGVLTSINICQVAYVSGCYLDDYYWDENSTSSKQYPKGQVIISYGQKKYYNNEGFNDFVSKLASKYNVSGVPALTLTEDCYMGFSQLSDDIANYYGYYEYYGFEGSFASQETALKDLGAFITALEDANFVKFDNKTTLGTDVVTYYLNFGNKSFNFDISYKTTNNLTNTFTIGVSIAQSVVSYEGDPITWAEFKDKFTEMRKSVSVIPNFANTVQLDLVDDIHFLDQTEDYKDLYGATYDEIYFSYFFMMSFDTRENAKLDLIDYAQLLVDAGFKFVFNSETDESITYDNLFDDTDIAMASYKGENGLACSFAMEFTDETAVRIGFFGYKEITA